jgi:RNase P/RNase MRP subunit POP5
VYFILKKNYRQRYIGFYIEKSNKNGFITKNEINKEIKKKCFDFFNKKIREMGIYLIKFDGFKGIIKCNHIYKKEIINIMESIESISSDKVNIKTIGTSGTIKKLINKYMNKLAIFL